MLQKLGCGFARKRKSVTLAGIEYSFATISHGGVTEYRRSILYGACWVQAALSLAILICGRMHICGGIARAEDLVERTMALTFVLEIDDWVYQFLLSPTIHRFIVNATPEIALLRGYGRSWASMPTEETIAIDQAEIGEIHYMPASMFLPASSWRRLRICLMWVILPLHFQFLLLPDIWWAAREL